MLAEHAGKPVAGALNLAGPRGAVRPQLGLPRRLAVPAFRALLLPRHRLGDRARLPRVEAGAQGRHKIQRGYLPKPTYRRTGSPSRAAAGGRRFPGRRAPGDHAEMGNWRSSRRSGRRGDRESRAGGVPPWMLKTFGGITARMDTVTAHPEDFANLNRRAFADYRTRALWNKRELEAPTPADALVIARALRVEGDRAGPDYWRNGSSGVPSCRYLGFKPIFFACSPRIATRKAMSPGPRP